MLMVGSRIGYHGEIYVSKLQIVKIYGKTCIQECRAMIPADAVEEYMSNEKASKSAKIRHAFAVLRKYGTGATKHTVRALLELDGTEVTDRLIAMVAESEGLQQRREDGTVFYDTPEAIGRTARIQIPMILPY